MSGSNLAQTADVTPLPLKAPAQERLLATVPFIGDSAWARGARQWIADHRHARVIGLIGDAGTGKTLLARCWHGSRDRAAAPCEVIDLRGFPVEVVESELFGYVAKGFFSRHDIVPGRLAGLSGGTCILLGFESLPAATQERCLPWLIDGQIQPVGSETPVPNSARVVFETRNHGVLSKRGATFIRPLCELIEPVALVAEGLAKRRDDIMPLAEYYRERYAEEWGFARARLAESTLKVCRRAAWPENVRSVVVAIASALHEARGEEIQLTHLPPGLLGRPNAVAKAGIDATALEEIVQEKLTRFFTRLGRYDVQDLYTTVLEKVERPLLQLALTHVAGNQVRAARLLGINRNTLRTRLQALGVKPPRK